MADFLDAKKKPVAPSQDKPLQDDKNLEEKKLFVNDPWKPVIKSNPSFNKPGYGGGKFGGVRSGGGRPTIRKHAARSR